MKDREALHAHTPREGGHEWHELAVHSTAVADMAADFAGQFGGSAPAHALGLAHDAAKADPRFQKYLRAAFEGRKASSCPHSYAGAVAAYPFIKNLALLIAGHHVGIPDRSDWISVIRPNADQDSVRAADEFLQSRCPAIMSPLDVLQSVAGNPLALDMMFRMLFSCLVDADRLDTEAHFQPDIAELRSTYPPLSDYLGKLEAHLRQFPPAATAVNHVRHSILASCQAAADQPPGVFSLTVPTGGGKTLSGLAFAMRHAVTNGHRRVVVAIPFTSITDQTAKVYSDIFGGANVLEHHSALDEDPAETFSAQAVRRRLAADNWDCPLVVTTTVQLFESLLSNRPSRCRKLHNLARAVLIIDEIQALPECHLGPILDVLHELVERYGVTVVLSTATPPDYSPVDDRILNRAIEIIPDHLDHFRTLRRVRFEFPDSEWDASRLRQDLEIHPQALVILNSRRDAVNVAQMAGDLEGTFHLSTLLCGHHRKAILATVRERLAGGERVRLISTQVVEAGVDVDFPRVYRALAPLDRIVQAAGRCNREGRRDELGVCTVFKLADGRVPQGAYTSGIALTEPLLSRFGQSITEPEATHEYTRRLFTRTETGSESRLQGRALIQSLRRELKFRSVDESFHMIEQDTTPVIVESYAGFDVAALLAEWSPHPGGWFRRVSPFVVNLYRRDVTRLQREGQVRAHESGAWVYSGPYDSRLGLGVDLPDPTDLVL
jgi:CRISPR-associated endonuclease/helicase Cas3